MTYPNLKNKHLEEAIINPDHFGKNRKKWLNKIPKKCIILYQKPVFNYLKRKFRGKYEKLKFDFSDLCDVYYTNKFCFCRMLGVGAPHAALVFEELIAIGINKFINVGYTGGLRSYGIFLCKKSIRDEGTSYHYIHHKAYAYPDKELTKKMEGFLKKNNIKYTKATNWTIDAPYRETKKEIAQYVKEGVKTVEMEASALFTVAKLRKVKIAAAFVVNDVLHDNKWEEAVATKRDMDELIDAVVDCLVN